MQVLQAVMAGIALAGAAVFLNATDDTAPEGSSVEEQARAQAQDLLDVLAQREAPNNASANLLAHEIAHARQGEPDLRNHVDRYFPHRDWSLVTRNEDGGVAEVAHRGNPEGVVTTGTRLLVPQWTYSWQAPRMELYSGDHPMQVGSVPVHNSRTGRLAGEPVKVTVTVDDGGEKEYHVYETVGLTKRGSPTATLIGETPSGERAVGWSAGYLTHCESSAILPSTELTCEFGVRFEGFQGGDLTPGTRLELDVPRGWRYKGVEGSSPSWDVIQPGADTTGPFTFAARVEEGHTIEDGDELTLSLNVTADPVAPFSTFEARLSNGTLSRGEIVVPHPGAEAKAPRAVYTSLPYPGVPSGTERWGIGFSNGLSEATVTEVTVESVSGTSLFADVAKVQDLARSCIDATCGRVEVSSDGTTITWSGSETVLQGETRDLILDVTTTDATTNVTSDERRAYPEVHFPNGYDQKLTRQVGAPGLYTARIPPEEPLEGTLLGDSRPKGYPAPAETSTEAQTYSARVEYWPRGELWKVDSNFTYTVDPDAAADELVLDTQGAVSASQVEVTPSTTTPGGLVWTRVNAANVLSEVAAQDGQDVEMTTRLYTPPTLGHEPAQAVRTDLSSEGVGEPVTDVHVADVTTHDGPEAALAAGDGQVHVYHVAKGTLTQTQLWTRDVAGEPRVLDSGAAGPASPRIYAGADEGTLTALDPSGGTTWTHDTGSGAVDALHPWRYPGASATDGIWALRHPTSGAGADQAGLRWYQVRIDRSTVTPTVTTEATGDAGGDSGAATTLGSRLATAVASSGSGARTWVNATAPDGSTAWSTPLEARFERVADAARLDADGDGAADLAVALATDGRSGQIVLLDGKGGDVIGRSSKESLALLTPVGDVTDAPGDEMAFASSANRVGLLEVEGGSISTPWVREVEPEHDASAPAVSADWDGQIQWNGCGGGPSCFLAHTSESGGTPPQPVGLDVVDRTAAQGGLVLAFTYSRGHEVAGTATGSIAYHDLDTGQEAGSTEVPPPAGTPVAADGDGVSWLAAGTDRGHLVAADPTATYPTNSQASGDRSVFHVPVAVEDGAFYGTYVVDVEIAWSPADISHRQSVHLTSRFSVIPASATQGPNGFVYDTKLNVASPTRP